MPQVKLAWRVAMMLVLFAPLCACQQGDKKLDQEAMSRQVHTLASLCAEGAFLTSELQAGHLKPSFASVHIDDLADDTNKARIEIAQPAQPALERQHAAAQALAEQLRNALRDLALAQIGADAQLEHRRQTFLHLKSEFDAIGKSL
jgi:hypothetical protein